MTPHAAPHKNVYRFIAGHADGNGAMKDLLGGKGAGLAEMTLAGLPVPPGFTITTAVCHRYYAAGNQLPADVWEETEAALREVEAAVGKRFGDASNPLLVSVRSGAKFSMPGMMDTVLNLGLNHTTVQGLIAQTGNERFARDAHRRFIQMFGRIVLGIPGERFDHALEALKAERGVRLDTELTAADLHTLVTQFEAIVERETSQPFPADPSTQLRLAICAVFNSWYGKRAVDYRRLNKIPDDLGTAVNVVAMVFGNMGEDSGTGVAFTRNPATGEPVLFGEYLPNAQGEDVVAGIRTPEKLDALRDRMPAVYEQFRAVAARLERHYRDVQDLEFTIERGKLWMLQTRNAKRTGAAAVRIAVDLVNEGIISREEAILRVEPYHFDQLLHPMVDPKAELTILGKGLPASPGAAAGAIVFDPDVAEKRAHSGERVILVRTETSPEDFHGMVAAQGILTARGGLTSHAAVVARGMGKPCIAGCSDLKLDAEGMHLGGRTLREGDFITLDGTTGRILLGDLPLVEPETGADFETFMRWVDDARQMRVRTNADTPHDAHVARRFGAEGIGLCRTEHMFFEGDRIDTVRQMIMVSGTYQRLTAALGKVNADLERLRGDAGKAAALEAERAALEAELKAPARLFKGALEALLPMQRADFVGIFEAMDGFPVTIRLLDPPLHEFLPHTDEEIEALAGKLNLPVADVRARVAALREHNPMLGHRGCRLGIAYPEITEMQARAIFEAAVEVTRRGITVLPEVMVPLVGDVNELRAQESIIRRVADEVQQATGVTLTYLVGTMIELPRAALTADKIATVAEFFSFGTNDLTQTTFGFSRDDAGTFLPMYVERKILADDPFQVLDQEGVGELLRIGTQKGRAARPTLKVGICGEHGGEPSSVAFCQELGFDYVSCSPYRVPIARLAAAQAALRQRGQ
ncbi:pyruvate, phosphate dikinase [Chloracidobacterium sp. MS 40/45]|uniref:pyruvate, phosphate dikinase n=1 Tax=Chloracidobacterium aggregatum TaxID=2851959 RepID=UPI001B8AE05E|nr:pyruvate, phosphate dikinase [Chloracidobacterium aggregatum]QUV99377.1 pyruvate, phosphate dikinase [Chloracidobacterium sp. MS 40/45]